VRVEVNGKELLGKYECFFLSENIWHVIFHGCDSRNLIMTPKPSKQATRMTPKALDN
ncbi:unnamed protein product, partial [Allacma fusca]